MLAERGHAAAESLGRHHWMVQLAGPDHANASIIGAINGRKQPFADQSSWVTFFHGRIIHVSIVAGGTRPLRTAKRPGLGTQVDCESLRAARRGLQYTSAGWNQAYEPMQQRLGFGVAGCH